MPDTPERWQNGVISLKDGIQKLYQNKEFSDVVFRVGRKQFKAHKLILSARCSEFSRMLLDPNAIDDIIVDDESVTETGFEILLHFIYTDNLGTDNKQSIVQAYLAADYYKQNKLKEKCEDIIESWSISVEEVCQLLNVSLGILKLKEKCLNFIKNNALDVISSSTFLNLNYKALVAVMKDDALKDIQIEKRVTRIIEWGAHQHTSPVNYALVRDDFLNQSPPLLGLLKIEELPMSQFSKLFTVDYRNLLTNEEVVNFMTYLSTKDRSVLPSWCSSS